MGGDSDGGYLLPEDISNIDFCFSPGVDQYAYFESDLISRGIKCYLSDNSVDNPPIQSNNIFLSKNI